MDSQKKKVSEGPLFLALVNAVNLVIIFELQAHEQLKDNKLTVLAIILFTIDLKLCLQQKKQ